MPPMGLGYGQNKERWDNPKRILEDKEILMSVIVKQTIYSLNIYLRPIALQSYKIFLSNRSEAILTFLIRAVYRLRSLTELQTGGVSWLD